MGAFDDQVAIVTGAGSGIGRAITIGLAQEGATVCLVGRTVEKLQETARQLNGSCLVRATDLNRDAAVDELVSDVQQRYHRTDILVLCAGPMAHGTVGKTPVEVLDRLFRIYVHSRCYLIQKSLPALKRRPGQIVVLNSSAGLSSRPQVAQYSTVQHAMRAATDALRTEASEFGVRVLSVYPGRTATPRMASMYAMDGVAYDPHVLLQAEDVASVVLNALMLPPTAEVTDISIRPLVKSY